MVKRELYATGDISKGGASCSFWVDDQGQEYPVWFRHAEFLRDHFAQEPQFQKFLPLTGSKEDICEFALARGWVRMHIIMRENYYELDVEYSEHAAKTALRKTIQIMAETQVDFQECYIGNTRLENPKMAVKAILQKLHPLPLLTPAAAYNLSPQRDDPTPISSQDL